MLADRKIAFSGITLQTQLISLAYTQGGSRWEGACSYKNAQQL